MDDKPIGRDRVRAALIHSAAKLFAERGPQAVSVREIARDAGVNHGLVHRHFGSKEGLLSEVMNELAREVAQGMGRSVEGESLADILRATLTATLAPGKHWRILARAMLDGKDPAELQDEFPVVLRMLEAARRGTQSPLSPEAMTTLLLSVGLGMMLFEPYLMLATGQDAEAWASTRAELGRLALRSAANTDTD